MPDSAVGLVVRGCCWGPGAHPFPCPLPHCGKGPSQWPGTQLREQRPPRGCWHAERARVGGGLPGYGPGFVEDARLAVSPGCRAGSGAQPSGASTHGLTQAVVLPRQG